MTRNQQVLLLTILVMVLAVLEHCDAEPQRAHVRRQRFHGNQRAFARQEALPTPYPLASELKPDGPALIYGPPQGDEQAPESEPEPEQTPTLNPQAEELDSDSLEVTTQSAQPARLRQRLAKLQQQQVKKSARLEELPLEGEVEPTVAPVVNPLAVPQFYYATAQQPYILAYSASSGIPAPIAPQQLAW